MTLELFPPGGLDSGVLTTVFIGVLVVLFFHQRFGWVASGLVIPGFVVPLLLSRPAGVMVIAAEAVLTLLLARGICAIGERRDWFCALFGRDRFFLIVVLSVAVRLAVDGFLLPALIERMDAGGMLFERPDELHSFGLVIVALAANAMWKPGILRGGTSLVVVTAVTWALVVWVLVPITNYSVGSLAYIYEDVATSIMASPKAYMLIICSAFIASRMNLFYGWEFNGILLPSLLALQWLHPEKLLATLIEIFVVYLIGTMGIRTRLLRHLDITGARAVGYFFAVAFTYKLALGWVLAGFFPDIKVSDYYAFGYLLSALLAAKMHEKAAPFRIARAAVQTSLLGAVVATLVGFMMTWLPELGEREGHAIGRGWQGESQQLAQILGQYRQRAYGVGGGLDNRPSARSLAELEQLARRWHQGAAIGELATVASAPRWTSAESKQGWWVFRGDAPEAWCLVLLHPHQREGPVLEVPEGLAEVGAIEAAIALAEQLNASAVVIVSGGAAARETSGRQALGVLHAALPDAVVVQVRAPRRSAPLADELPSPREVRLELRGNKAAALPIARIERRLSQAIAVRWIRPDSADPLQDRVDARLVLSSPAVRALLFGSGLVDTDAKVVNSRDIGGFIEAWLQDIRGRITPRGGGVPLEVLSTANMLYFDNEVLTPLDDLASAFHGRWQPGQRQELQLIASRAAQSGMAVWQVTDADRGQFLVVASDGSRSDAAHSVLLTWRLTGRKRAWMVTVPRPLLERGAYEFAADLFADSGASILLVAGAHPYAASSSATPADPGDSHSLFDLSQQVLARQHSDGGLDVMAIRTRPQGSRDNEIAADVVVHPAETDLAARTRSFGLAINAELSGKGLSVIWADGSASARSLNGRSNPQFLLRQAYGRSEVAALWLRPSLERRFQPGLAAASLEAKLQALGISSREHNLLPWLRQVSWKQPDGASRNIVAQMDAFADSQDVTVLASILDSAPQLSLLHVVDVTDRGNYLVLKEGDYLLAAVNLQTGQRGQLDPAHADSLRQFLKGSVHMLSIGATR